MTPETLPPALDPAVQIVRRMIGPVPVPYRGTDSAVVAALHAAGWLHNPDDIERDRDAARAEIDWLTSRLRAERRSHAETWQRATENGRQLTALRTAAQSLYSQLVGAGPWPTFDGIARRLGAALKTPMTPTDPS